MMRHVTGKNREQTSMELLCFDDLIDSEYTVRAIDTIVDRLDTKTLGFEYSQTKETGRKPYNNRIIIYVIPHITSRFYWFPGKTLVGCGFFANARCFRPPIDSQQ
jgi:hypothetical protein